MNAANTLNYDKYFEFAKNIEDLNHSINIKVSELLSIAEEDC
jgi:hypothetical protein